MRFSARCRCRGGGGRRREDKIRVNVGPVSRDLKRWPLCHGEVAVSGGSLTECSQETMVQIQPIMLSI